MKEQGIRNNTRTSFTSAGSGGDVHARQTGVAHEDPNVGITEGGFRTTRRSLCPGQR